MNLEKTTMSRIIKGINFFSIGIPIFTILAVDVASEWQYRILIGSSIALPWLVIALLYRRGSEFEYMESMGLYLAPLAILLLATCNVPLVNYRDPLVLSFSLGLLYFVAAVKYLHIRRRGFNVWGKTPLYLYVIAGILIGGAYGYGTLGILNAAGNSIQARYYSVIVNNKYVLGGGRGKRRLGFLRLKLEVPPWGQRSNTNALGVSPGFFSQVSVGDRIEIGIKEGNFHWPWIYTIRFPEGAASKTSPSSNSSFDPLNLLTLLVYGIILLFIQFMSSRSKNRTTKQAAE